MPPPTWNARCGGSSATSASGRWARTGGKVTRTSGEHHLTIPWHDPLRVGTLRGILGEIMQHHGLTLEAVLRRLGLG